MLSRRGSGSHFFFLTILSYKNHLHLMDFSKASGWHVLTQLRFDWQCYCIIKKLRMCKFCKTQKLTNLNNSFGDKTIFERVRMTNIKFRIVISSERERRALNRSSNIQALKLGSSVMGISMHFIPHFYLLSISNFM